MNPAFGAEAPVAPVDAGVDIVQQPYVAASAKDGGGGRCVITDSKGVFLKLYEYIALL